LTVSAGLASVGRKAGALLATDLAQLSDEQLVDRVKAGDDEAFGVLVERYQSRVYRMALRVVRNPSDAEEVLQETFLSAFRHMEQFREEARFSTWIYRIGVNAALMHLRARKHGETVTEEPEAAAEPRLEAPRFSPSGYLAEQIRPWAADSALLERELEGVVRAAVAELPGIYGSVFLLRDIEELSTEEVAEILGITPGAVKTRLHRARIALRQKLARYMERPQG
jgi:RNA polymerase sigma-70 factor (ECF subfamily)